MEQQPATACEGTYNSVMADVVYGPHRPINPFVHEVRFSLLEQIKIWTLTFIVVPIRLLIAVPYFFLTWFVTYVGSAGITEEMLANRTIPQTPFRRLFLHMAVLMFRFLFVVMGFHWVPRKGTLDETVGIRIAAPHTTFLDITVLSTLRKPTALVRIEHLRSKLLSPIYRISRPIAIDYANPKSRDAVLRNLGKMAKREDNDDNSVTVWAEGVCGNGKALLPFKLGAFMAGEPVQPVCVSYPNKNDVTKWTWHGPTGLQVLWWTLAQFHSRMELQLLPTYYPSEEEKKDPALYAENVRKVMAAALDVPITPYSFDDCIILSKTDALDFSSDMSRFESLRSELETRCIILLRKSNLECKCPAVSRSDVDVAEQWLEGEVQATSRGMSKTEFKRLLGFYVDDQSVEQIFTIFRKKKSENIDVDFYLFYVAWFHGSKELARRAIVKLFKMMNLPENNLTLTTLQEVLQPITKLSPGAIARLFQGMDEGSNGTVCIDDVERFLTVKPEYVKFFAKCHALMSDDDLSSVTEKNKDA